MNKVRCYQSSCFFLILWFSLTNALAGDKPLILQAKVYEPGIAIEDYWVSEKLDGVRARWDGKQLISRNGNLFHAPKWFTEGFPNISLDGELWSARGKYQQIVSIVGRDLPHEGWRQIKFMVFDLPDSKEPFSKRVAEMEALGRRLCLPFLRVIKQFRVQTEAELMSVQGKVVSEGGEGLMLHHQDALYHHGRSDQLLKLKPYNDAEAIVIGYRPGKGLFAGKMGAIKVRTDDKQEFFIGSGFSHQERESPPSLGARITFRHQGFTDKGIPRFAVFLRVREKF